MVESLPGLAVLGRWGQRTAYTRLVSPAKGLIFQKNTLARHSFERKLRPSLPSDVAMAPKTGPSCRRQVPRRHYMTRCSVAVLGLSGGYCARDTGLTMGGWRMGGFRCLPGAHVYTDFRAQIFLHPPSPHSHFWEGVLPLRYNSSGSELNFFVFVVP